jgi:hypothetical protein
VVSISGASRLRHGRGCSGMGDSSGFRRVMARKAVSVLSAMQAGVPDAPQQHQRRRDEVEAVQRPDRTGRQVEHIHRVHPVADVGEHQVAAAVGPQVSRLPGLDQHGKYAGGKDDGRGDAREHRDAG